MDFNYGQKTTKGTKTAKQTKNYLSTENQSKNVRKMANDIVEEK